MSEPNASIGARSTGSWLRALACAPWLAIALSTACMAAEPDIQQQFGRHDAASSVVPDHGAWDKLLDTYVTTDAGGRNRVDYRRFKAEGHDGLRRYLDELQSTPVTRLNRAEQFAFWANLYNAKTIEIVLSHYPVASIRDIAISPGLFARGPWGKKVVSVEGVELSLDDIEHKILRAIWHDPRVHYAVNCASVGCPNLARTAFTGARLEAMLEAGARAFVNHPRGIEVKNGKVTTSSIYDWYEKDFGGSEKAVLDHVRHYASPELAQQIKNAKKVAAYQYDWRLNDSSDHGS